MGETKSGTSAQNGVRRIGRLKSILFGIVAIVLFFGLIEVGLYVAGVPTLLSERDPFAGFSSQVRVYERDAESDRYRTRSRAARHSFNIQDFAARKPENGLRIFVIGGSSAYGFPWGASVAFPRLLEAGLQASRPEREVEVVNAAAMSYGSHRLRILTQELLEYEPDLLIVYGGHNEFVERRFYRDLLERPEELDRLRRMLYGWRLYSLLSRLREPGAKEPASTDGAAGEGGSLLGVDVDREYSVNVSDEEIAQVDTLFRQNLEAIVAAARQAGVPVLLSTVPSNLRDWRPNQSRFDPELPFEQQQQAGELLAAGSEALEQGDPASALERLEQATELAPGHAEAWFQLGRTYETLGRPEEARTSYLRARDRDAQPARAVSALNDTIRDVAGREGVLFVDAEQRFVEASADGLIGFNLIEDYVHPNPQGHRLLARELWTLLEQSGTFGAPGRGDAATFERAVADVANDPTEGETTPSLLFNLAVVLENQGATAEAMAKYRECITLNPNHIVGRSNLGRLLNLEGRHAEAAEQFSQALRTKPDHMAAMIGLGESLRGQGRIDQALQWFNRATATDAGSAAAWNRLGATLAQLNRFAEAEPALARAVELAPRNAQHQVDLGYTLLFLGKIEPAEAAFRAGAELRPDDSRARNGLAAILMERGELDRAEQLFRQSLAADPRDAMAGQGLGEIERRRGAGR